MMKQMTIPCAILSNDDIESLRKGADGGVCRVALEMFSTLQNYQIQNGTIVFKREQINKLKKGLEALKIHYSGQPLGNLAKSILERIEYGDSQPDIEDWETAIFQKLEQIAGLS